jgi:glycerophosphoryl diester phosphodiesterase
MNASLLACVFFSVTAACAAAAAEHRHVPMVAHRGESHDAPENTLPSFDLAWSRGDEAAELDVHLTKDGKLIISHDPDTKRLSKGSVEMVIKDHTADELRKLDMGSFKDAKYAGAPMPLLDEVLARLPDDPKRHLLIEVKIGPEAISELIRCLDRAKRPDGQVIIISFNADTIAEAKRRLPKIKAYWLAQQKQDKQTKMWAPAGAELIAKAKSVNADGLDVQANEPIDAAFIKSAHDAGLELHVWTVDDPERAKALIAAGVDSITTNRAAWLREQVQPAAGGQ